MKEWGWLMCELSIDPRRHIMEDLSNEKFSLHLIQCRVCPYGLSCFSAIKDANLPQVGAINRFDEGIKEGNNTVYSGT